MIALGSSGSHGRDDFIRCRCHNLAGVLDMADCAIYIERAGFCDTATVISCRLIFENKISNSMGLPG